MCPFPYCKVVQPSGDLLSMALRCRLPWHVLVGCGAWIKLRSGALELGHIGGKKSRARLQYCIACDSESTDMYLHSIFRCPVFNAERSALFSCWEVPVRYNREALYVLLQLMPGDTGFVEAISLASSLEQLSVSFWKTVVLTSACSFAYEWSCFTCPLIEAYLTWR